MTVHTKIIVWMRKQSRAPEISPSEHHHTTSVQRGASGASWAQPGTTSVTKHDPCNRTTCIWGSNHVCDVGGIRGTTHFSKNDRAQGDTTNTHTTKHTKYIPKTNSQHADAHTGSGSEPHLPKSPIASRSAAIQDVARRARKTSKNTHKIQTCRRPAHEWQAVLAHKGSSQGVV